jgi:ribosomal protein S18 acetylase RimI-like enzyme
MWVAPFARGHGVGDSLVRAVIEWAGEQRASRVALGISLGNARAVALYRRHRFVDARDIGNTYSGGACERLMVRDL